MKKKKNFLGLWALMLTVGLILIPCLRSEAGVKGKCSNCHTMHNSQEGENVNYASGEKIDAQSYLIKGADLSGGNPCLGCHARGSGEFMNNDAPQVNVDPRSNHKLSAAGTYYFVNGTKEATTDGKSAQKGHNVLGLSEKDGAMPDDHITPPGGTPDCVNNHQLSCAGSSGCHGNRNIDDPLAAIKGGHHSSVTDSYRDGNSVATSYRMLLGVKGRVAKNWEYGDHVNDFLDKAGLSNPDVNIYQASDNKLQGDKKSPGPDGSINGLCGECHGSSATDTTGNGFHSFKGLTGQDSGSSMSSPWKRHPTDVVMNKQASEYWDYPGVSGKFYSQEVPVGFVNIRNLQQTDRVVLCVSCHRAHGSQYDDALRWDYDKMQTGASEGNGCFRCHTKKKGE